MEEDRDPNNSQLLYKKELKDIYDLNYSQYLQIFQLKCSILDSLRYPSKEIRQNKFGGPSYPLSHDLDPVSTYASSAAE